MRVLREILIKRENNKEFINVAIIGSGWFGSGVIREFYRWPGIIPRIVITRTITRAIDAYKHVGIRASDIADVNTAKEYKEAFRKNKYMVSDNLELLKDIKGIDCVFEATGDVLVGSECAFHTINQKIPFTTANIEMDGTIGFAVEELAKKKGVVYSACDGDQPGVLSQMIDEVRLYGCEIVVAGSCKNFLDIHQTPEGVKPWVRPGHNPRMISAFADGTKQSLELGVLANATGLVPDVRGMHGPTTTKPTLVEDYLKIIKQQGIVDFAMGITGIDQAAGVFVVGKREDELVAADLDYLKKGKGPYYLFFKDHHLCYFSAAKTVAEAVLFKIPTLPHKRKMADVLTMAKKDLKAGETLDGIGGFSVYGLIDKVEVVRKEDLLPVGLTAYAVLTKDAKKDSPITYDMGDFPRENMAIALRKKEDVLTSKEI